MITRHTVCILPCTVGDTEAVIRTVEASVGSKTNQVLASQDNFGEIRTPLEQTNSLGGGFQRPSFVDERLSVHQSIPGPWRPEP
jgi:hypothetical protein